MIVVVVVVAFDDDDDDGESIDNRTTMEEIRVRRFLDDGRFFFLNSKKWGANSLHPKLYFFCYFRFAVFRSTHFSFHTHTQTHTRTQNTLDEGYSQCSRHDSVFRARGYLCSATDDFTLLLISPSRRNVSFDEESFFFLEIKESVSTF